MLLPDVFGRNAERNYFDDLFAFPDVRNFFNDDVIDKKLYGKHAGRLMKTDIKENDEGYELAVDIPGFKKEEIAVSLENGYLNVKAEKSLNNDEKDKEGKIIRQERYAGAMQRSFYVGDAITEEDVKAKYEDGVLMLNIPKKEEEKKIEEKKLIAIE